METAFWQLCATGHHICRLKNRRTGYTIPCHINTRRKYRLERFGCKYRVQVNFGKDLLHNRKRKVNFPKRLILMCVKQNFVVRNSVKSRSGSRSHQCVWSDIISKSTRDVYLCGRTQLSAPTQRICFNERHHKSRTKGKTVVS